MVLPIYNAFHPILRQKTRPVENIDDTIVKFVDDMLDTMNFAEGIGLAANQVGRDISLLVVGDIYDDGKLIHPNKAYINPKILEFSEDLCTLNEGCLSIPEFRDDVERPKSIHITYFDLEMREHSEEVDGLLARVLQHEIDHLNGILFFDRLKPIRRTLAQNKLKRIRKGIIIPNYPMILPDGKLLEAHQSVFKA